MHRLLSQDDLSAMSGQGVDITRFTDALGDTATAAPTATAGLGADDTIAGPDHPGTDDPAAEGDSTYWPAQPPTPDSAELDELAELTAFLKGNRS